MSQENHFTGHERATTVNHDGDHITVSYHNTTVVSVDTNTNFVTFDTGGYETATTRRRINQACATFGLPFRAYIKDYALYVEDTRTGKTHGDFPLLVKI